MRLKTCVSVLCLTFLNIVFADDSSPIVKLPHGKIQGHVLQTADSKTFYAYQQIPYASPPVGPLRFMEPVDPEKWDDTLDASENTVVCYQGSNRDNIPEGVEENEDCLYLNVYTPLPPEGTNTLIPVLVWIHGGNFQFGDGTLQNYGPQYFIDHDIVVVTFNYRMGPFGFLTAADKVIPANIGLKDQNFVLQWVQKNIKLFGGDPTKVVIAGENAGGVSVGYQLLSEKSKGLFRAAILQSGTALSATGYQPNAKYFAFEMGRTIDPDFTSRKSSHLLELLQNASAEAINNADIEIPDGMDVGLGDNKLIWLPIIENIEFPGVMITNPMHESFKSGTFNRVPVLLGFNSEEKLTFIGDDKELLELGTAMDTNFTRLIHNKFNMTSKYLAGRGLRQIYSSGIFQKNLGALVRFLSDEGYSIPIIRHADLQSPFTDVYLYQFSHKGMLGALNKTIEGADTVGNGEELNYLWVNRKSSGSLVSVSDKLTKFNILELWSNFIKYLNPTPEDNGIFGDLKWPKVTPTNIYYLNINRTLEVRTDPRYYKNVKEIIDRYAEPPLVTY